MEGESMSEWKEVRLRDVGKIVGGATPSTRNPQNYGGVIPWITPKDLSINKERFIEFGERNISELGLNSCSAKMLPKGSILFSSRAPIGYVAIAHTSLCTNQGFKSFVPDTDKMDSVFSYYLLKHNSENIANLGSGTTFMEVSGKVMSDYIVNIPDLSTQQEIAGILSSLDAKIETNNKLNEKLEEMAQAIFKSWFVDFEPFKDKPFHETELGMIPEGWEVLSLTDIATFTNGLAMQKFRPNYKEPHLPVLKIKELRQGFCDDTSEICIDDISDDFIADDGDIIFSWSGTLLVDIWCGGKCGVNQHLFKVTSEKYNKWFFYFWIKRHLAEFIRIAKDKAVTMGHIKRGHLTNALVVVPNEKTMQNADKIFTPIIDKIIEAKIESKRLASLRDTLLPRLMSGELIV